MADLFGESVVQRPSLEPMTPALEQTWRAGWPGLAPWFPPPPVATRPMGSELVGAWVKTIIEAAAGTAKP